MGSILRCIWRLCRSYGALHAGSAACYVRSMPACGQNFCLRLRSVLEFRARIVLARRYPSTKMQLDKGLVRRCGSDFDPHCSSGSFLASIRSGQNRIA